MKKLILLFAFFMAMVIGCEKQTDYTPIDWAGNYSYNSWVLSIDDSNVTLYDSGNELTIRDSYFEDNVVYIFATQELSGVLYRYEIEGELLNGKSHNRRDHYIRTKVQINIGTEYYGKANWLLREY